MFDGQFSPYQPIQFLDGIIGKPPGVGLSAGITFVGAIAGAVQNGGDVVLDLSGLGLAQNDIVVATGGFARAGTGGATTSGYTVAELFDDGNINLSLSYKFMGASPDAYVTLAGDGNTADAIAYVALAFRGVNTGTPLDTATTAANGSSTNPNPPSITTVTNGAMVIACAVSRSNDNAITAPSGYAAMTLNQHFANQTDTREATAGMSYLLKASAGAEDPGAFGSWLTGDWAAATIALRPA